MRFLRIVRSFLPFALVLLRDRNRFVLFGSSRTVTAARQRTRARELRETLLALGPTFVKIGQVLSTRPDVVPPVYAEEFAVLQDAVPSGPLGEMEPAAAGDLDRDAFDEFDPDPIAGGSLAQVHEARYRGQRVAVKVRRPGVVDLVETDLRVLRRLIPVIAMVAPARHRFSLRNLTGDFERIILEELDFEREGRVMDEIRANFAGDDSVLIPRRFPEVSSESVLTMSFVESIKITDVPALRAAGFDPEEVARKVANAYFEMGIEHGLFHGDPHPGNLGIDSRGRIVFYDFGMTGRFTREMQDAVVGLYLGVARRDMDGIIDILIDLGTLDPTVDRAAIAHVLGLVVEDLEGRGVTDWREIIAEAMAVLQSFPFRIPPDLMLVIRVGTVGEGVLRQIDPDFDFVAAARAFLVAHGYMWRGIEAVPRELRGDVIASARSAVRLPSALERVLDQVAQGELAIEGLKLETPLVAIGRVLAYALITAAWIVGSSVLTDTNPIFGAIGFTIATVMTVLFLVALRNARRAER
ncbi:ABC1 kinase family protein [Haloarcula pelagica]|uniref:ABC1 kinase family protein n=1 Tax=Haloarcula pelagica TaxID=3033389 RepID=UPI0024C30761|nr:AarF/UbiB family protein [Halomicroarcula sp. YJ-61-S]